MNHKSIPLFALLSISIYLNACGRAEQPDVFDFDVATEDSNVSAISMTLQEALGQIFLIRATDDCQYLQEIKPGGVVFWGADVNTEATVRAKNLAMQRCLQSAGGLPLLTSTNHEGGRVHYFKGGSKMVHFPAAMTQCQRGKDYVFQVSSAQATELAYTGMNMTLGPDADVLSSASNVIGDRAYGRTPAIAGPCVEAAFNGYERHKVKAVLKHFPGHGGTSEDTHEGFVSDNSARNTIESIHLAPFKRVFALNSSTSSVMTSHIYYPALDNSWPATLSKAILTDLLRDDMQFSGVIMSDSMTMGAIVSKWSLDDATILSFMAGADMVMIQEPAAVRRIYGKLLKGASSGLTLNVTDLKGRRQTFAFTAAQIKSQISSSANRIAKVKNSAQALNFGFLSKLASGQQPDWAKHAQLGQMTGPMGEDPTSKDP